MALSCFSVFRAEISHQRVQAHEPAGRQELECLLGVESSAAVSNLRARSKWKMLSQSGPLLTTRRSYLTGVDKVHGPQTFPL